MHPALAAFRRMFPQGGVPTQGGYSKQLLARRGDLELTEDEASSLGLRRGEYKLKRVEQKQQQEQEQEQPSLQRAQRPQLTKQRMTDEERAAAAERARQAVERFNSGGMAPQQEVAINEPVSLAASLPQGGMGAAAAGLVPKTGELSKASLKRIRDEEQVAATLEQELERMQVDPQGADLRMAAKKWIAQGKNADDVRREYAAERDDMEREATLKRRQQEDAAKQEQEQQDIARERKAKLKLYTGDKYGLSAEEAETYIDAGKEPPMVKEDKPENPKPVGATEAKYVSTTLQSRFAKGDPSVIDEVRALQMALQSKDPTRRLGAMRIVNELVAAGVWEKMETMVEPPQQQNPTMAGSYNAAMMQF